MMLVKTYVADSGIHGCGLFAGEAIAAGTKIWQFMEGLDPIYDAAMLTSAPEPIRSFLKRYTYPHPSAPDKIMLDGDHTRFMNHSETPNCIFDLIRPDDGFALRAIAAGEEMTCNYYEYDPGFKFG